jgi:hypothetical protein
MINSSLMGLICSDEKIRIYDEETDKIILEI